MNKSFGQIRHQMEKHVLDFRNSVRTRESSKTRISNEQLGFLASRVGDYKKNASTKIFKGRAEFKEPNSANVRALARAYLYCCPTSKMIELATQLTERYDSCFAPGFLLVQFTNNHIKKIPMVEILKSCSLPHALVNFAIYGIPNPGLLEILSESIQGESYLDYLADALKEGAHAGSAIGFSDDAYLEYDNKSDLPPNYVGEYGSLSHIKQVMWDNFTRLGIHRNTVGFADAHKAFQHDLGLLRIMLEQNVGKPLPSDPREYCTPEKLLDLFNRQYVRYIRVVGPIEKNYKSKNSSETEEYTGSIPKFTPKEMYYPCAEPMEFIKNISMTDPASKLFGAFQWQRRPYEQNDSKGYNKT